jgi:hypothetical protein
MKTLRLSFVTVAHWPAGSKYAKPAATTGPVLNILMPDEMPNTASGSSSRWPTMG